MTSAYIYHQRMRPQSPLGEIIPPPIVFTPTISVSTALTFITEGGSLSFSISRFVNLSTNCSVKWTVTSAGGSGDFSGSTTGTINFTVGGQHTHNRTVLTVNRAGDQGDRSATITLSDFVGCVVTPGSGSISVLIKDTTTVTPPDPPDPPGVGPVLGFLPDTPPTSSRILQVPEDYGSVSAAITAANIGDTISVADGFKVGTLTISKAMSTDPNKFTILRSRNKNKAILDGKVRITGQGWWLWGFKSTYRLPGTGDMETVEGSIEIAANYTAITRCEIQSHHGISSDSDTNRKYVWIGWCTFNGQNSSNTHPSNIWVHVGTSVPNTAAAPNNWDIYRNLFTDTVKRTKAGLEDHVIYIGNSHPTSGDIECMDNFNVRQNLIESGNLRTRAIYMKWGGKILQNHIKGCKNNWGARTGGGGRIESNTCTSGIMLAVSAPGVKVYNNVTNGPIRAFWGCSHAGGASPIYPAADNCEFDRNTSELEIGYTPGTDYVKNTDFGGNINGLIIWKHTGTKTIRSSKIDSYDDKGTQNSLTYLPRLDLTSSNTGVWGVE